MKRFIVFVIIIFLGIGAYEFYGNHREQIASLTEGLKDGSALENIKTEIFTPGGLRAKIESANSNLTLEGVISATNQERSDFGKSTLKENARLNAAALAKVKDMFAGQYFEHVSPTGRGPADLAKDAGYVYISIGENLALGNYKDDVTLVEAWMNSPGHRANILNGKFTEIGAAVMKGTFEGKTTWLAVQEFGRPASDCPRVDEFLKDQIDAGKVSVDVLENQVKETKAQLDAWPEPESKEEVDAYNAKVAEYNNTVKVFNNRIDTQKDIVARYNNQVKAFNACIGS